MVCLQFSTTVVSVDVQEKKQNTLMTPVSAMMERNFFIIYILKGFVIIYSNKANTRIQAWHPREYFWNPQRKQGRLKKIMLFIESH